MANDETSLLASNPGGDNNAVDSTHVAAGSPASIPTYKPFFDGTESVQKSRPRRNDEPDEQSNRHDKTWKKRKSGSGFGSKKVQVPNRREQFLDDRAKKRQKLIEEDNGGNSFMSIPFTTEEIANEERRPKRKVAVMVGYAGTGYHGLQINHREKSIEGDLFAAFVATGAIAKANADDPKKSSLTRCARTDKGVHAAGNVLSLKLIIEDDDIVEKINAQLPPQIRVWGIERTSKGFSAYQSCESRWYEYLMPSYALLPPHPQSFLAHKLLESAGSTGVLEQYTDRLDEAQDYWDEVEKTDIQPILDALEPSLREDVVRMLRIASEQDFVNEKKPMVQSKIELGNACGDKGDNPTIVEGLDFTYSNGTNIRQKGPTLLSPAERAVHEAKNAHIAAKRRYRVTASRLQRLQEAVDRYIGTHNFHNYTILKKASDPSAKRHIKSFVVNTTPIRIRDTEWLSLKVHGQSFMMHQIRKMVAMAVMIVRCGTPLDLITQTYEHRRISIPKAPGLGLMLERPVFTGYNNKAIDVLEREPIDFAKYDAQIQEFKDREIYSRMFEVEEKENTFHSFFNQIDNFRTDYFLWVTAGGINAAYERAERGSETIPEGLKSALGNNADGVDDEG